jgi:DNA-binding beta-propeller fold protein YncE
MNTNRAVGFIFLWVSAGLAFGLAGRPAGSRRLAYVSNLMSHSVSVIDLDKGEWVRDLDLGRFPIFSSLHPRDATKMLLAFHNYDRTESDDQLVCVDLETGKIVQRAAFPGPGIPSGFVYDLKRDRIYIADENLHKIFALDGKTLEILFDWPAGLIPLHVDISPDGRWLAATNRKSANLYLYDLNSPRHAAKDGICVIPLGPAPGISWDPDESGKTPSCHPVDVKFGASSDVCFVTDFNVQALLAVDIKKREVAGRVSFENAPFGLTLNRARNTAYVCLLDGNAVAVVDLEKMQIASLVAGVGPEPINCELDEDHGQLIVACWGGFKAGGIHIVDLNTRKIVKTVVPAGAKASIGITIADAGE